MIRVAAAVIEREGKILIAQRGAEDPLAGKWEFPGGKIEAGETPEACLVRELLEELGIHTRVGDFLLRTRHAYEHAEIELVAYRVDLLSGNLCLHEHADARWVTPGALDRYDFAPADLPVVRSLQG